MATVYANKILTIFMLLLDGHYHYVKVSSDSETVHGMGLWEFFGALRELMLICILQLIVRCFIYLQLIMLSSLPSIEREC